MNKIITLRLKYKNWILITLFYYFEFLCKNIPNIIQIISLPSALGILAKLQDNQIFILSIITTSLLVCFLSITSDDAFNSVKQIIWSKTGKLKDAQSFWNYLNYIVGVLGGIVVISIVNIASKK